MGSGGPSQPAESSRPAIRIEGAGPAGLEARNDLPGAARPPDTPSSAMSTSSRYVQSHGVPDPPSYSCRYTEGGIYDTQSDETATEDGIPQLTTSTPGLVEMNQEGLGQTSASVASTPLRSCTLDLAMLSML